MKAIPRSVFVTALVLLAIALGAEVKTLFRVAIGDPPAHAGRLGKPVNRALTSRPATRYDPDAGYVWSQGRHRIARVRHDALLFDVEFRASALGFPELAEEVPGASPIALLGDSATAALFLQTRWPQRANEELRRVGARPVAWHGYANDGIGAVNWARIYSKWIDADPRYRRIVIASCCGSQSRPFMAATSRRDGQYYALLPTIPKDEAELETRFGKRLKRTLEIADDRTIEALTSSADAAAVPPFGYSLLPLLEKVLLPWRRVLAGLREKPPRQDAVGEEPVVFPETRSPSSFLEELAQTARRQGREVVWISLPDAETFEGYEQGVEPPANLQLKELAAKSGGEFIDGFSLLASEAKREKIATRRLWLFGDPHWNQLGSDLFARGMARIIAERGWNP